MHILKSLCIFAVNLNLLINEWLPSTKEFLDELTDTRKPRNVEYQAVINKDGWFKPWRAEQSKRMIEAIAVSQKCDSADLVVVTQGGNNLEEQSNPNEW